jgi:tRNA pseudouridine38-40 synthase
MTRLRLVVAYDGSGFHGFALNEGVPTVAGALSEAIGTVLGHPVTITAAGRTDTGVHAWGQVVSFDLPDDGRAEPLDLEALRRSVNALCGPAVVVRSAESATPEFDARFSARWRRYRYTVLNDPVPDPFLAATTWQVDRPLDLRLMRLACDPFIGEHDFSSFCRRPKRPEGEPPATLVRRVTSARWDDVGEVPGRLLRFEIVANAFCHQMVRSIVGTLVEVGLGRRSPGSILATLRARDRSTAGQLAPPHGLCLYKVGYDDG